LGEANIPKRGLGFKRKKWGHASQNCRYFPSKIANFGLKCGILKENAKNSISGRSHQGQLKRCAKPVTVKITPFFQGMICTSKHFKSLIFQGK
jgi:hypothetical protein